ncbi:hypothetical protein L584_15700 [Pantoea agglomerans Tx10]|nr:hypothetical protein L584_15700 [Pantoea agglomerans Tx10]KDA94038.1 hypothetical protein T296_14270 [Pantoea agglomerans Eh318]
MTKIKNKFIPVAISIRVYYALMLIKPQFKS